MKPLLLISIILTAFCQPEQSQQLKNNLKEFNKFLGPEKALALDSAIASFDTFLTLNYPNEKNEKRKIEAFLNDILKDSSKYRLWRLETNRNKKILKHFEESGLRKEIWLYPHELSDSAFNMGEVLPPQPKREVVEIEGNLVLDLIDENVPLTAYDSVQIERHEQEMQARYDSSLFINGSGQFFYAIAKFTSFDPFIQEYMYAVSEENNISPGITIPAFLENRKQLDEPFFKRILIAEFYYFLMKEDV